MIEGPVKTGKSFEGTQGNVYKSDYRVGLTQNQLWLVQLGPEGPRWHFVQGSLYLAHRTEF